MFVIVVDTICWRASKFVVLERYHTSVLEEYEPKIFSNNGGEIRSLTASYSCTIFRSPRSAYLRQSMASFNECVFSESILVNSAVRSTLPSLSLSAASLHARIGLVLKFSIAMIRL